MQISLLQRSSAKTLGLPLVKREPLRFGDFGFYSPENPSTKAKDNARYAAFQAPIETPWIQKLTYYLGKGFLIYPHRLNLQLDPADIHKLNALPPDAGNIFAGPHPDVADGPVLYSIFDKLNRPHAAVLMASDMMNPWLIPLYRRAKILGVHRGNAESEANSHAKDYTMQAVSQGGWAGLLSEGCVSWSRKVVEMRKGAVEMAIGAAIRGEGRPIYITPLAFVYFHTNPKKMQKRMLQDLAELESLSEVYSSYQKPPNLPFPKRLEKAAHRILDFKARVHGVSIQTDNPATQFSLLGRMLSFKAELMKQLEARYGKKLADKAEAFWVMEVRGKIQAALAQKQPPVIQEQLKRDLSRVTDLKHFFSIVSETSLNLNDPEDQGTLLRKLREMMKLKPWAFGKRDVIVKVLDPMLINPKAAQYIFLGSDSAAKEKLITDMTEDIRQKIQEAIYKIVSAHSTEPTPKAQFDYTKTRAFQTDYTRY